MFPRTATGTWLHSTVVVVAGAVVLVAVGRGLAQVGDAATLRMLAVLVPALAIGLVTRRHPLLVGAGASLLASLATRLGPDDAIAAALVVAVAALAGRALRHRFAAPR